MDVSNEEVARAVKSKPVTHKWHQNMTIEINGKLEQNYNDRLGWVWKLGGRSPFEAVAELSNFKTALYPGEPRVTNQTTEIHTLTYCTIAAWDKFIGHPLNIIGLKKDLTSDAKY